MFSFIPETNYPSFCQKISDVLHKPRKNIMNHKLVCILIIAHLLHNNTFIVASSSAATTLPIITRETKNNLPADVLAQAQQSSFSILKPTDANRPILYKNYPDGSVLFPNNSDIASKFNVMVKAIQANPDVIEFFRKVHINALNQLYMYLMKIYTNFNIINPGYSADTATPVANISDYLANEAMYATNKKKLVINHFINLLQYQFGASIISYVPTTPADVAVTLGKIFVHNDCGIDLTPFTVPQTDAKIIASQTTYLAFLQLYIDFFQTYTQSLSKIDANGINQYYTIAQGIQKYLYPQGMPAPTNSVAISSSAASSTTPATPTPDPVLTKMNPTMFFYDVESMRSIQFIPFVAGTIPTTSQLIPWSQITVDAAVKNLSVNGHPVAYFKDIAGKNTQDKNQAQHLYLLTETGPSLFEQELLAQPAWLNTQDGSIRILRACLGDVSALVGLGILDAETETIVQKALASKNGQTTTTKTTQSNPLLQPAASTVQPPASTAARPAGISTSTTSPLLKK